MPDFRFLQYDDELVEIARAIRGYITPGLAPDLVDEYCGLSWLVEDDS